LERQLSNRVTFGIDYTGSRDVRLYDIQALNNLGHGNRFLGDPCSTSGAQILANFTDTGSTGCLTSVTACKGCNTTSYRLANDRRNLQLALKLEQVLPIRCLMEPTDCGDPQNDKDHRGPAATLL
jgi:hypothetical protein